MHAQENQRGREQVVWQVRKKWYQFLQWQDYALGVWSCRAMQWRGFATRPIHPKHLFDEQRSVFLHQFFEEGIAFLDLGSGVGTDCLLASGKGAALAVGLEGNRQQIITSMQRRDKRALKADFLQIDFEQGGLPFANSCFDIINFSNVLEHLHNRAGILTELKRVKKENGIAILSVPNAETSWKKKRAAVGLDSMDDPDHKIEYSKQSLTMELNSAGLAITSDLQPIIPSFPWNGLIAMSAALSPRLYKRLQKAKRRYVEANPDQSIGWVFTVG